MAMPDEDFKALMALLYPQQANGPLWGGIKSGTAGLGADLLSIGAAVGISSAQPYADKLRALSAEISDNTPGVKSFGDIGSAGDFADYAKFLFGSSLPTVAATVLPGVGAGMRGATLATRALAAPALERAALGVGEAAGARVAAADAAALALRSAKGVPELTEQFLPRALTTTAAEQTLAANRAAVSLAARDAATAGGFAGGMAQGTGDVLSNQYEQTGGYNLLAAVPLGAAYSALNFLGPEAALLRGATGGKFLPKVLTDVSEKATASRLGRAGLGLVGGGVMEGVGETGQEVLNQLGRMAVDPTASLTKGGLDTKRDPLNAYFESFMGGLTLGGITSGVGGAFTKTPAVPLSPEDMAARVDLIKRNQENIAGGHMIEAGLAEQRQEVEAATAKAEQDAAKNLAAMQAKLGVSKDKDTLDFRDSDQYLRDTLIDAAKATFGKAPNLKEVEALLQTYAVTPLGERGKITGGWSTSGDLSKVDALQIVLGVSQAMITASGLGVGPTSTADMVASETRVPAGMPPAPPAALHSFSPVVSAPGAPTPIPPVVQPYATAVPDWAQFAPPVSPVVPAADRYSALTQQAVDLEKARAVSGNAAIQGRVQREANQQAAERDRTLSDQRSGDDLLALTQWMRDKDAASQLAESDRVLSRQREAEQQAALAQQVAEGGQLLSGQRIVDDLTTQGQELRDSDVAARQAAEGGQLLSGQRSVDDLTTLGQELRDKKLLSDQRIAYRPDINLAPSPSAIEQAAPTIEERRARFDDLYDAHARAMAVRDTKTAILIADIARKEFNGVDLTPGTPDLSQGELFDRAITPKPKRSRTNETKPPVRQAEKRNAQARADGADAGVPAGGGQNVQAAETGEKEVGPNDQPVSDTQAGTVAPIVTKEGGEAAPAKEEKVNAIQEQGTGEGGVQRGVGGKDEGAGPAVGGEDAKPKVAPATGGETEKGTVALDTAIEAADTLANDDNLSKDRVRKFAKGLIRNGTASEYDLSEALDAINDTESTADEALATLKDQLETLRDDAETGAEVVPGEASAPVSAKQKMPTIKELQTTIDAAQLLRNMAGAARLTALNNKNSKAANKALAEMAHNKDIIDTAQDLIDTHPDTAAAANEAIATVERPSEANELEGENAGMYADVRSVFTDAELAKISRVIRASASPRGAKAWFTKSPVAASKTNVAAVREISGTGFSNDVSNIFINLTIDSKYANLPENAEVVAKLRPEIDKLMAALHEASQNIEFETGETSEPWLIAAVQQDGATITSVLESIRDNNTSGFGALAGDLLDIGMGDTSFAYTGSTEMTPNGVFISASYSMGIDNINIGKYGATVEGVTHEAVHAITMHKLAEAKTLRQERTTRKLTDDEKRLLDAYDELHALMTEAREHVVDNKLDMPYALRDADINEFVAGAKTNSEFQALLHGIGDGASVWVRFLRRIAELIGIAHKASATMLDRVLTLTPEFYGNKPADSVYSGVNFAEVGESKTGLPEALAHLGWNVAARFSDVQQRAFEAEAALPRALRTKGSIFTETMRRGKELINQGIAVFNTSNFAARNSLGFTTIKDLEAEGNSIKQMQQNHFNEMLKPLAALTDPARRAAIFDWLLATTTIKLRVDRSELIANVVNNPNQMIYEVDGNRTVADTTLRKFGVFTHDEMKAGDIKGPGGAVLKSLVDEDYHIYDKAMGAMQNGAAALYRAIDDSARERRLHDVHMLGDTLSNDAIDGVLALRDGAEKFVSENTKLDKDTGYITALDTASSEKLKQMDVDLYGLMTDNALPRAWEETASTLGITQDDLRSAIAKIVKDVTKGKFHDVAAIVLSGANERTLMLSERALAVKSIVGGYIPTKRYGKWMYTANWVDDDGKVITGVLPEFERALLYRASDDQGWLESEREAAVKAYAELPAITIRVRDGKAGEADVQARIAISEVAARSTVARVSDRIDYVTIMRALDSLGIKMPHHQREDFITKTTNANSAVRRHMERIGQPAPSMDFMTAISEDLSRRSALIASRMIAPRIDIVLADKVHGESSAYWSSGKAAIAEAKKQLEAAEAGGVKDRITWAKHNLASQTRLHAGQQAKTLEITYAAAKESADYYLSEGAADEDWAGPIRSAVTVAQLGLSFAAGFTNFTSIPLHSLAALSSFNPNTGFGGGFGETASAKALIKAFKVFLPVLKSGTAQLFTSDVYMPHLWLREQVAAAEAMPVGADGKRAKYHGYDVAAWEFVLLQTERGTTAPQQYNAMMSSANKRIYGSEIDKAMGRMMALFSTTEQINRLTTLLAAHELFSERAEGAKLSKADDDSGSSEFARYVAEHSIRMVTDTQGEYSASNRPRLFRNGAMSMLFMYKTFAVTSLELLRNMSPRGRLLFVGMLSMFSGVQGLPLFEEMMILFDMVVQKTGVGLGITKGNAERELDLALKGWGRELGLPLDRIVMRGILDNLLGTQIFGRAGINVGVPLIGLGRAGTDIEKELGKTIGPAAGAFSGMLQMTGAIARGEFEKAGKVAPITAIRNTTDAYMYAKYGNVLDRHGKIVTKGATEMDAIARVLGFYPTEFEVANDRVRMEEYTRSYVKEVTGSFLEDYRKAKILGDSTGMRDVQRSVQEYNAIFKGTSIEIQDFDKKAQAAGKDAVKTLLRREEESLPRNQKRVLRDERMEATL